MLSMIYFIKIVIMKEIRFTLIVLFLFSSVFISCEKSRSHSNESEDIPGMGDSEEELEVVEPLNFPLGLSLVGDITGVEVNSEPLENPIGSGGQWVILDLLIQNVSDNDANFFLLLITKTNWPCPKQQNPLKAGCWLLLKENHTGS